MSSNTIDRKLAEWLSNYRRLVIACVGNSLRSDDGLGIELAKMLSSLQFENVLTLDCGTVPETYVGPIRNFHPSHILIVDAAEIGSTPGTVKLVSSEEIVGLTLSTHALPLNVFADYLKQQTNARIALLVIQPKNIEFGEHISKEVWETLERVSQIICHLLKNSSRGDIV